MAERTKRKTRNGERKRTRRSIEEAVTHVATADEEQPLESEKPKRRRKKSTENDAPVAKKTKRTRTRKAAPEPEPEAEPEKAEEAEDKGADIPLSEDDSFFIEGDKGAIIDLFRSASDYVSGELEEVVLTSVLLTVDPEESAVTVTGQSESDAGEFTRYGEFSTNSPDIRQFIVDPERILTALTIIDGDTVSLEYDPEEMSLHVRDADAAEGEGQNSDIRLNPVGKIVPSVPSHVEEERIVFDPEPLLQAYQRVEACTDKDGASPIAESVFAHIQGEDGDNPVLRMVGANPVAIGLSTTPLIEVEGDRLNKILFASDGFGKAAPYMESGEKGTFYLSEESANNPGKTIIILVVQDEQSREVAKIHLTTYATDPNKYPIANVLGTLGSMLDETSLLVSADYRDIIGTMNKAYQVLRLDRELKKPLIHMEFDGEGHVRIHSEGDMKTSKRVVVHQPQDSDGVNESIGDEFTVDFLADVNLHVAQSYSGSDTVFLALSWNAKNECFSSITLTDKAGASSIISGNLPDYSVTPLLVQ